MKRPPRSAFPPPPAPDGYAYHGASYLDEMVEHYVQAAIWTGVVFDDECHGSWLDECGYGADDLAPETLATIRRELSDFLTAAGSMLQDWTAAEAGHDLCLTRGHHGAGFWDRGKPHGDDLTALAHALGEAPLYVGDDGKLYV